MTLLTHTSQISSIPEGWSYKTLEDITLFSQYGINSSSGIGMQYPMLKMNNLQDGAISIDDIAYINLSEAEYKKYALQKNDILINRTNSPELVGKTSIFNLNGAYVFASYLVRFRLTDKVDPIFVNYYLNSESGKRQLRTLATKGVSQANINPSILQKRLILPIPPLSEQRKIAEILSTWDHAIDLTSQLIITKQQRKRGLMQELLKGQQRFAEFEGEEWKLHEFADFALLSSKKFDPKQQVESIRCVELEHISQETGQIIGETLTEPQQSIKNIFAQGQVLFGKLRPYLRKYAQPRFSGVCSSEIWVFDSHTDLCINDYLFYLVQTEEFIRVASASSGSKMPRSDWELVSETIFALPSIAEQRRIAEVLQACDREIELLQQKRDLLKQQKQGLMQQLLTGRVRVAVDPVEA